MVIAGEFRTFQRRRSSMRPSHELCGALGGGVTEAVAYDVATETVIETEPEIENEADNETEAVTDTGLSESPVRTAKRKQAALWTHRATRHYVSATPLVGGMGDGVAGRGVQGWCAGRERAGVLGEDVERVQGGGRGLVEAGLVRSVDMCKACLREVYSLLVLSRVRCDSLSAG